MGNEPPTDVSADAGAVSGLQAMPLHSTDLLTLLDEDGIIRYDSPAIEHIYGYQQDQLVGHHVTEYFHPDDHDRVLAAFEALTTASDHHVEQVEHRFLVADGSYKWIESVGSSTQTPEGYYVINTRDISERKERERELAAARQQIEAERDGKEAIRQLLLETTTDDTLAETVCQQLVETHGYAGAWIVRSHRGTPAAGPLYQIDATHGDDAFRCRGSLDDAEVDAVTRSVLTSGEACTVTVESTTDNDLVDQLIDCGLERVRSVPLEHGGVSDGVLTVVRESAEPMLSAELVTEFASALGFKRRIRRQRRALQSETVTEVSMRLSDGHFLARISAASVLPAETHIEAHLLQSVDGVVTYVLKIAAADASVLASAAKAVEGVLEVTPLSDTEPASRSRARNRTRCRDNYRRSRRGSVFNECLGGPHRTRFSVFEPSRYRYRHRGDPDGVARCDCPRSEPASRRGHRAVDLRVADNQTGAGVARGNRRWLF